LVQEIFFSISFLMIVIAGMIYFSFINSSSGNSPLRWSLPPSDGCFRISRFAAVLHGVRTWDLHDWYGPDEQWDAATPPAAQYGFMAINGWQRGSTCRARSSPAVGGVGQDLAVATGLARLPDDGRRRRGGAGVGGDECEPVAGAVAVSPAEQVRDVASSWRRSGCFQRSRCRVRWQAYTHALQMVFRC